MRQFSFILCFFLLSIFLGCAKEDPQQENLPDLTPLSADQVELVASSNDFSLELFKKVNETEPDQNTFISPLSVGMALAMVYNGADGETKTQIQETLGFEGLSSDELNQAFQQLRNSLLQMDKKVNLNIANSVWYDQNYEVQQQFKETMLASYDAEVRGLDFSKAGSKDVINSWVAGKTNDKIQNLLLSIPSDVVMYLINAVYFKADWTYQFDKAKTKPDIFYTPDATVARPDMMHSDGAKFLFYGNEQLKLIDLPYGNQQYSMTIILPEGGITETFLQGLSANTLQSWLDQTKEASMQVVLPKFKSAYEKTLNEVLIDMGIETAFTQNADLSNLLVGQDGLLISRVLHKAFIEVNEEGSEAAAATAVEIGLTSVSPAPPVMVVNRPFVYLIREKHTGAILFAGKMLNPLQ